MLKLIPVPARSFSTQLLLLTFGVLAIAIVAQATIGILEGRAALKKHLARLSGLQLNALHGQLANTLRAPLALATELARDPAVARVVRQSEKGRTAGKGSEAEVGNVLRDRARATAGVRSLLLVDETGAVVAGTDTAETSVAGERSWKDALGDGVSLVLPAAGSRLPAGLFSLTVAVEDAETKTRTGAVQLMLSIDELTRLLSAASPADGGRPDWRAAVVDAHGSALVSGAPQPVAIGSDADFSGLAGSSEPHSSAERLVYSRRIPGFGKPLTVAVAIPKEEIAAPLRRGILWRSGLLAVSLALAAGIFLPLLGTISRDLSALVDYARRTGAGDTTATPPRVKRSDEIGALGSALVGSLESLRSSRAELERAKKTLEERVEARTGELARVNHELKKRAEELAAASKSKDEFLTNVSHELRTPLNSIIGLTQLVRDGHAENTEEANVFLDQALVSARHLLTLINDVLDLAKLEAGKVVLELEPLDAADVVTEVRQIVEPLANAKHLTFTVSIAPGLPQALGDRIRLRQVLVNIVQNGIKFTQQGGVTIRVRTSDGRRKLLFEVEDTGIGIPPEKRGFVFEKFIQAEAGTTRRFGGTGLGLPISRLLVEAMGGGIGLESGSGGTGTRVWFTVPTPGLEGR